MSDKFNRILPNTLKYEGGLTTDHAGLTNFGVTQGAYDRYNESKKKAKKSVKDITYGEVSDLYKQDFYKQPKINLLSENLGGAVFDYAVNSGAGKAVKALQTIVGTEPDGIIGPKTLEAISKFDEGDLVNQLLTERSEFLTGLVQSDPNKYGKFADGWANRISDLQQTYGK